MHRGGVVVVVVFSLAAACGAYSSTDGPSTTPPPGGDAATDASAGDSSSDAPGGCDPALLATDPKNCGACGHDCLGGACTGGVCQPVLVATSPDSFPIVDLALEDQRVVWLTAQNAVIGDTSRHGLYACPKTGCTSPPATLADDVHSATSLVSDGKWTYAGFQYNGVNGVFRLDSAGFRRIGTLHPTPSSLHYDAAALWYLGLFETDAGPSGVKLYRGDPPSGLEALVCSSVLAGIQNVESFALADGVAYLPSLNDDVITACALGSGVVTQYTAASKIASSIAAGGGQVLWVDSDNELESCAAGPTCNSPNAVVSHNGGVREVAWSAGAFYFAAGNGDLVACETPTCSNGHIVAHASTMGSGQPISGHGIVADATAIYYAASDGASWQILRVAR